jgi:hypothetical protein
MERIPVWTPKKLKMLKRAARNKRLRHEDTRREKVMNATIEAIKQGHELPVSVELATRDNEKKKLAIELLTDFLHSLRDNQVASLVGITPLTLRKWRHDPVFAKLLNAEITRKKELLRLEAYKGWFRAIRAGDTKVIEKYFKMTGDLTEEVNVNFNDLSKMDTTELAEEIKSMELQLKNNARVRPN